MGEAKNLIDGGKTFDDLPATLRSTLNATAEKDLRKYAAKEPVTKDATWYALMQMSARDPERFKNVNLLNHLGDLSRSDFQEVSKVQLELQKGKTKEIDGFRSVEGIVSGTVAESNLSKEDKERFMRVMDRDVKAWKSQPQNQGKDIPNEVVQDMTDAMLKKVITDPGWLWDTREPLYKAESQADVDAKEKMGKAISKMPMEDRQRITNDLKARGIVLTEANILRFYEAMLTDRRANAGK
jgi:hypothetical protein